jgi:hypothetical protein
MRRLPKGETAMSTLSMLKFRASIFAAVLAFATLSPASHAQDVGMFAKMNVPFAFEIGSQHYSAGVYTMGMDNQHILVIKGVSGSGLAMTSVDDNGQPAQRGVAVFHKYGNQYFLSEISVTGMSRRIHLRQATAESKLEIAQNKTAPQSVEVAVSQGLSAGQ